jgi:putative inorganic carbon (HCO3(-)) transporter
MLDSPMLISYPFGLRVGLLIALIFVTVKYTRRGMQNGILLGLITGMSPIAIVLFRGAELLPGTMPNISLDRIVWPIVLIVFFLKRRRGETERLPLDGIEYCIFALIMIMLLSMVSHGSYTDPDGDWALFRIIRGYIFPFAAYFIARRGIRTGQQLHGFLVGLAFMAMYIVFIGIAERFSIHWLIFPQFILKPDIGVHFGNSRGIFLNASTNGLAIATALPFLIWLYFADRAPRRYLWPLVAALSIVPLIFTFQRAAWLSAFAALGVAVLAWPRKRVVLTGFLVFFAACSLYFASDALMQRLESKIGRQGSIDYRLHHIERGWAMFQANPVLGVGLNRYAAEVENYSSGSFLLNAHAHNTWITLLAELGLVGFFPYSAVFVFALVESIKFYRRFVQYRAILGILVGVTLAFLAMSISIEVRGLLYANALIFTLWGMHLELIRSRSGLRLKRAVAYRRIVNFI